MIDIPIFDFIPNPQPYILRRNAALPGLVLTHGFLNPKLERRHFHNKKKNAKTDAALKRALLRQIDEKGVTSR